MSTASAFTTAMDAIATKKHQAPRAPGKTLGENGAPEYTLHGAGDARVALFFNLVRGLSAMQIDAHLDAVYAQFAETADVQVLVDLVLIAFQTRASRGDGKGERALFVLLMRALFRRFPATVDALLALVPRYGYYKDLLQLAEAEPALTTPVLAIFHVQLVADTRSLEAATAAGERAVGLSLAAKWAPREGRHFSALARALAARLYPDVAEATARRLYRLRVAALNRALGTVEIAMSAKQFGAIDFGAVPAICLARNRKAFLNETVKGAVAAEYQETGNRHPLDDDRIQARKRLRAAAAATCAPDALGKGAVNGAQLHPHQIVQAVLHKRRTLSEAEGEVLDAQWTVLRDATRAQLARAAQTTTAPLAAGTAGAPAAGGGAAPPTTMRVDLGKLVALVDVSVSMEGEPMQAAIALGILVSELTAPAFADRVLTFETQPRWVDLSGATGVVAKTRVVADAPWGGSTNFEAALNLVLDACVAHKLRPDEIPDLLCLSDMQFDVAHGGGGGYGGGDEWETHLERVRRRFNAAGVAVCGQPYPAPRIIFWNLAAPRRAGGDVGGLPAQADAPNVQMLSGFSAALLKLVLAGAEIDVVVEETLVDDDGRETLVRLGQTPYDTLRAALDAAAFDAVRETIARVGEGPFADYEFETTEGFIATAAAE